MADRIGVQQQTIPIHLQKMPELAKLVNTDLSKGFTVSQVAEKHGCPGPFVWSIALERKTDQERFKALNWGLITWDHWYFNDVDQRFGDDWPGQIPAQLVARKLITYITSLQRYVYRRFIKGFWNLCSLRVHA